AQMRPVPLEPVSRLKLHHVTAAVEIYRGRKSVCLTDSNPKANLSDGARFAIIEGADFENGVIEADVAGDALPGMPDAVRGFTGLAFRMSPDGERYEAFYLRPKNGRSEDQLQRNHSAQYISIPEFGWQRLRKETPGQYETYVDLVPGAWTPIKIAVQGKKAQLYVHSASQPTLIVNGLKHGQSRGVIALWISVGVTGHFANLRITKQP
ncbi:MAG: hypothetical protein ACRD9L_11065, partial [Bryobacteraceae bacterium]